MLKHQSSPPLVNGVTQQSRWVASESQVLEQVNAVSDVVEGLRKRPPTEFVAKITQTAENNAFVHEIKRDADNKYIMVVTPGGIVRVFDLEGNELSVSGSSPYLNTDNPRDNLRAVTVADYTFIVNREVVTSMSDETSPERDFEALIYVRAGNYGRTYKAVVNGQTAAFTTPDGSDAAHTSQVDSAYIAQQLFSQISGVNKALIGSVIYLSSPSEISLETEDGTGNANLLGMAGSVQRFERLPRVAQPGMVLKVEGDASTEFDDYYVEFVKEGVWRETTKPGTLISFDATTLPHALVRQPDDSFTIEAVDWGKREAGDEESAPAPSFIGSTIRNVYFERDRLGFIKDEGSVQSRAGEYFQFWPTTVTTLLDGDPIDVTASSKQVAKLEWAVPFDKDVVLFGDEVQFVLGSEGTLTPETVSLPILSQYPCAVSCEPVLLGRNILFAFDRNGATGVREMYVDSEIAGEANADEVTAHCPRYIAGSPRGITGNTSDNLAVIWCSGQPGSLFIYKYHFERGQKLQNSWSRWDLWGDDTNVLFARFVDRVLYLVLTRAGETFIEKMDMRSRTFDEGLPYKVLLDSRVDQDAVSTSYSEFNDETLINLPLSPGMDVEVILTSEGEEGHSYDVVRVDGNTVTVSGDLTGKTFFVGQPYAYKVVPVPPTVRTQANDGSVVADPNVTIKVKNFEVVFQRSGYFEGLFKPDGRPERTQVWSAVTAGSYVLNEADLKDSSVRFKTTCADKYWNFEISNSSHLPCSILSFSWQGVVAAKSRG